MCLVRYRPPVNKLAGAMTFELFSRIVDEVPGLRRLTLPAAYREFRRRLLDGTEIPEVCNGCALYQRTF
jgi:hypothetical protein